MGIIRAYDPWKVTEETKLEEVISYTLTSDKFHSFQQLTYLVGWNT